MRRMFFPATLMLCFGAVSAADAPNPAAGVVRGELFTFSAGDRIEDSGQLSVSGGRANRTEDFEVVRHPDGGRTLTSIVAAADGRYRVHMRLTFDAHDNAQAAIGNGSYEGKPIRVEITRSNSQAELVLSGSMQKSHSAPCSADCLIDMSPSALSMFTMTRRYDESAGGAQAFRWVGRSLIGDQVLLDGTAEIRKLGDFVFRRGDSETAVKQYVFVEELKDEVSGKYSKVAFNLYTTADHRPLAFVTGGTTVGERVGYEGITAALPKQIPEKL